MLHTGSISFTSPQVKLGNHSCGCLQEVSFPYPLPPPSKHLSTRLLLATSQLIPVYQVPVATNYPKFSGLKQHRFILSLFWRPEVQMVVSKLRPRWRQGWMPFQCLVEPPVLLVLQILPPLTKHITSLCFHRYIPFPVKSLLASLLKEHW